ncbi:MAG: BPSS1780 family membrane protein [Burkholderiales bacterium]
MKLQHVPAKQGALWVRQSFLLFFKHPLAFSALLATFLFGGLLLVTLPWIGPLVSLAALPLVTVAFMIASRQAVEKNINSTPMVFVEPLQKTATNRRALVQLGLVYAVCSLLIMALAGWVDGGTFAKLQAMMLDDSTKPEEVRALLQDPQMSWGMTLRFGLAALLTIPFWHAPALTHWGGYSWGKALFFSWMACWRNKGAFFVYSLTWVAVVLLFAVLSSLVLSALGQPRWVVLMSLPAGLMFTTAFYASLYFTYADCFSDGSNTAQAEETPHA